MYPLIGMNLPKNSPIEHLGDALETIRNNGFDAVEINLETYPLIIGGAPCRPWVDELKKVLQAHPFRLSAHIGRFLDLRDIRNYELNKAVLVSALSVVAELKMNPLVLHYDVRSNDRRAEQQFLQAHLGAADIAGNLGITLCVENLEVELVEPLVEFIETANHPNLRINIDTGHTFLASKYFNFDFLEAIRLMAPFASHIHLNDNTGRYEESRIINRVEYDGLSMQNRRELGRGDIHLPPYYGKIPFDEVFKCLTDYQGLYMCEYTSEAFTPMNARIQQFVRERILSVKSY